MNITATSTVRDLAAGIPGATRVFENFGIDYCCGGRRTLADACREASLPVEDLTRALEEAGRASQPGAEVDWRRETLTALTVLQIRGRIQRASLLRPLEPESQGMCVKFRSGMGNYPQM